MKETRCITRSPEWWLHNVGWPAFPRHMATAGVIGGNGERVDRDGSRWWAVGRAARLNAAWALADKI